MYVDPGQMARTPRLELRVSKKTSRRCISSDNEEIFLMGDKWITQFYSRLANNRELFTGWCLSSAGQGRAPLPTDGICGPCEGRFRERSRASGYKNSAPLWGESTDHVREGAQRAHPPFC